jgi:DNA-binding transcriptional regulator YdaS (Cro superfamily)
MMERPKDEGLALAIKAAGTGKALAEMLGISQSAVSQWKKVPAERVIEVERVTKVSRTKLRPDLYVRRAA